MYIASLGQEACVIMDVFSCIPFSEKFCSYLGCVVFCCFVFFFFCYYQDVHAAKIFLQAGETVGIPHSEM